MDFTSNDEQQMLRDGLRRFLRDLYPFDRRVAAIRSQTGWQPEVWSALATQLGLLGVGAAESSGGSGGGAVEHMLVMQEFGRALVVEPYLETVVIGSAALGMAGTSFARDLQQSLIAGHTLMGLGWLEPGMRFSPDRIAATATRDGTGWRLDGLKSMVTAAPWANWLLVAARTGGVPGEQDGLSLFVVEKSAPGISEHAYPTIDGRRASDITFDGVALPSDALIGAEGQGGALVDDLLDRAIAATAAESVGAMEQMHSDTLAYVKERRQFGQPLASFQVLQHRLVDMYMQVEMAQSASYLATLKLGAEPSARMIACSSAKITIANACRFVGQNAIQLHGGMGMTDELAISHYFKRTSMIEREFGGVDDHVARYARLALPRPIAA